MTIARATFMCNEIEPGWLVLGEDVPIGKVYQVDVDRIRPMTLFNRTTGLAKVVDCIWVVEPTAGWLPMGIFKIETTLAGLPVTVASDAECEQAAYVVCGNESYFDDDVHTSCGCGAPIVHRPYVPNRPPKICGECFIGLMTNGPQA